MPGKTSKARRRKKTQTQTPKPTKSCTRPRGCDRARGQRVRDMNPNKRPPPSSSAGAFEGGDATKRARDHPDKILRPGQEQPGNVLLVRVTDIVHPVRVR